MDPKFNLQNDGKFLFICIKSVARYRIAGSDLIFEDRNISVEKNVSAPSAYSQSLDGKQVAVAYSQGDGSTVSLLDAMKLTKKQLELSVAKPAAKLGIDPLTDNVYVLSNGKLEVFSKAGIPIASAGGVHVESMGELIVFPQGERCLTVDQHGFHVFDLKPGRLQSE